MFGARGRVVAVSGVMMRRFVGGATRRWNASASSMRQQQQQQQQRSNNNNGVAVRTRRRRHGGRDASTSATSDEGVTYVCEDERATERLARALAGACRAGDVLCLRGRVGAGKSAFARAFVRATFGDATMDVPSPTYLVQQRYEGVVGSAGAGAGGRTTPPTTREVHHYDLYRLSDEEEIRAMVDLDESVNRATSLIEWSERLGRLTPSERLDVYVSVAEKDATGVVVRGGAEEDDEEDEEVYDDDDEVDEAYVDKAHRSYRFVPNGGDWESRLAALKVN
jgi:tRNA threonylcarbamoyladenosine biosynthesis protein TsaE